MKRRHYDCEGNLGDLEKLGFDAFTDGDTASAPAAGDPERKRALWRCELDVGERTLSWTKIGDWSRAASTKLADEAEEFVRVARGARSMVAGTSRSVPATT